MQKRHWMPIKSWYVTFIAAAMTDSSNGFQTPSCVTCSFSLRIFKREKRNIPQQSGSILQWHLHVTLRQDTCQHNFGQMSVKCKCRLETSCPEEMFTHSVLPHVDLKVKWVSWLDCHCQRSSETSDRTLNNKPRPKEVAVWNWRRELLTGSHFMLLGSWINVCQSSFC